MPGIGKHFWPKCFSFSVYTGEIQPVVVQGKHPRSIQDSLKGNVRQVFYYDDFLGQTGWEDKLDKNEEQSILEFIAYVRTHRAH